MGILEAPSSKANGVSTPIAMAGALCPECGNSTIIHKDGCEFCTACGHIGSCG
jgi:ribonucleoside-diphosphate reductase alpha chain